MFTGIEHTGIASADPARLAEWYVQHLGFVINVRAANGRAFFLRASDGTMIEIIEANAPPPAGAPDLAAPGIRHLAIQVTDVPAAYAQLQSQGVAFLTGPTTVNGNSTAFFTDCDGNIVHLLHRETPLP